MVFSKTGTGTSTSTCTENGNQCQNGGVCVLATDQKDGETPVNYCQCPEGTSGSICHGKDVCTLTCEHGSSCRHHNDENSSTPFYCECVGNYKGLECEIPFKTCPKIKDEEQEPLECLFGGECVAPGNPVTEYNCSCPNGREGKNCEEGQTSTLEDYNGSCFENDECKNGGLCVRQHDSKTTAETGMLTKETHCLCLSGWGGLNCGTRCESLNCQHGSSCRFESPEDISHGNDSEENGAYCDCVEGNHKGLECEIAVNKCPGDNDMECLYGGTCVGSEDDGDGNFYNCACPPGRKGTHCENVDHDYNTHKMPVSQPGPDESDSNSSGNSNINNNINNNSKNTIAVVSSESGSGGSSGGTPIAIILFALILALLVVVPFLLLCLRRRRLQQRNADSQQAAVDSLDDTFTKTGGEEEEVDSVSNTNSNTYGDDTSVKIEGEDDDIFDYDTAGVVNVNLDDDEPPELHKDKQIV